MDMHDEQRYQNLYLSERLNTNNMISNNAQLYEDPTIISISAWKQTGYERKIRTPYKDLHIGSKKEEEVGYAVVWEEQTIKRKIHS
jgi:hypothetical protein